MLDTSPLAVSALRARTRDRSNRTWVSLLAGTPLALDEATLNTLSLATIEAPIAIADEVMDVKGYEAKKTYEMSYQQIVLDTQAILDGFAFVSSKWQDLYAIWQIKDRIEAIKIQNTNDIITETLNLLTVELAAVTLQLTAIENDITVEAYDKVQSLIELQSEANLKAQVVAAREALQNAEAASREQLSTLKMQMDELINAARKWTYLNRQQLATKTTSETELIGNAD